ncbi:hypothetical protein DVH24_036950 [Malus domestica]|uniref:Dilute domain-containing protein n=1 Tax=Malus domestica TaxID=3750 RepID=A0A498IHN2_MALDO|nr:hypothetical protein DVH24_036950 [Malus domestica]
MASSVATPLTNVSAFLPLKLDRHNYLLWRAQFVPLLRSRSLMPFVDGTSKYPPAFLIDDDGQLTDAINPLFEPCIQQDQMFLSPPVMHVVVKCVSAAEAWTALQERYAPSSHNRVIQLRGELLNLRCGDLSIFDFLDKINNLADQLALSGALMSDAVKSRLGASDLLLPIFQLVLLRSDLVRQVEAKYPTLLFKQQLTAYVEKIYGIVRDNLKKELSLHLSSCIQVLGWKSNCIQL